MLALLHTSPVHVPVFDALRDREYPDAALRHVVDAELLARASQEGPEAVADAVAERVGAAVRAGARAVLCTCSTIGAVAERSAAGAGVPVLRVDRPMAAAAAAHRRIAVVAAVAGTLGPTEALIREEAAKRSGPAGAPLVEVVPVLLEDAWGRFLAGDREGYLDAVATGADAAGATGAADVIVLAQASMAGATTRTTTPLPVLTSPPTGFRAAMAAMAGAPAAGG
jgi:hypothetical protein